MRGLRHCSREDADMPISKPCPLISRAVAKPKRITVISPRPLLGVSLQYSIVVADVFVFKRFVGNLARIIVELTREDIVEGGEQVLYSDWRLGLRGQLRAMEDNFIEHERHDGHHDMDWGSMKEVAFWTIALLVNFAFIFYAAWRLAVRHTDATGSSVLVPMKVVDDDTAAQSTAVQNARRRGGKQELPQ